MSLLPELEIINLKILNFKKGVSKYKIPQF